MRNYKFRKSRSLLVRGGAVCAISILLLCATGCHGSKATDTEVSKIKQPTITTEVSTTCTTTSTTATTVTTLSTTTSVITTTFKVETTLMTQPIVENQTIAVATEPVYVEPVTEAYISVGYNESDVVLLAKLINREASATYDGKVMVGSCVVNRMNIKGFSVSDVIFEQGQFTTAYSLSTYTDLDYQAAQQVLSYGSSDTRIYYFDGCHPDGLNWFYDINRNYLGAW